MGLGGPAQGCRRRISSLIDARSGGAHPQEENMIRWLIVGLIAGWLTGKIMHGRGYGVVADIVLGLIGGVIGGWIFNALGVAVYGMIGSIAMLTIGAVALVGTVHLMRDA